MLRCLLNWDSTSRSATTLATSNCIQARGLCIETQPLCLAGSAVVDWLVFAQLALTRVEALTLASALLEEGFLRTVGLKSAEALRSGGLSEQFLDDSTALYSFVSTEGATLFAPIRSEN